MIFKFAGTTDPAPFASRASDAFIVHGQHHFSLGWTRLQSKAAESYPVLRPAANGVYIANPEHLPEDPSEALEVSKNVLVNWSGNGANLWIPGCQGVSGKSYINHHNEPVKCASHSAANYSELSSKTRGAYNVLMDLIAVFGETNVRYSVIHEKDLGIDALIGLDFAESTFKRLKK
jgi:hypothetical protein